MSRRISLSLIVATLSIAAAGPFALAQDAGQAPGPTKGSVPALAQAAGAAGGRAPVLAQAAGAATGRVPVLLAQAGGPPAGGAPSSAQAGPTGGGVPAPGQAAGPAAAGGTVPAQTPETAAGGGPTRDTSAESSGHPKPVCFNLTGRCVPPAKGSSHKRSRSGPGAAQTEAGQKSLDLTAPDVRSVVPAAELQEPLPSAEQITEVQESQTVAVKGESPGPEVPLGFGAIWWALNHPSTAWKIFLPEQ